MVNAVIEGGVGDAVKLLLEEKVSNIEGDDVCGSRMRDSVGTCDSDVDAEKSYVCVGVCEWVE